jgi:dihydroneopterin aldolase
MSKIRLNNLQFYSHIGVLQSEKDLGQKIEIDLELELDFSLAAKTDDLAWTLNYAEVNDKVAEIVGKANNDLLESLAYDIANQLIQEFPIIDFAKIKIRKYSVPMPGIYDNVEVELELAKTGEIK